jgi:VanZ family protein
MYIPFREVRGKPKDLPFASPIPVIRFFLEDAVLRWLILILLTGGIAWLSLTSAPPTIDHPLLGWDKLQHTGAYGVLTLAAGRRFRSWPIPVGYAWGLAVGYAIGVGGLIEVLQGCANTGRASEWLDLLADACGALAVYGLAWWWRSRTARVS